MLTYICRKYWLQISVAILHTPGKHYQLKNMKLYTHTKLLLFVQTFGVEHIVIYAEEAELQSLIGVKY